MIGILSGLVARGLDPQRRGADLRTSLLEAMSTITIDAVTQMFETGMTPSRESRHPQAQSFCPLTADGGAIALHLSSSQKFWLALTRAIERPDLAEDTRFRDYYARMANYFVLRPMVEAEFLKYDRQEWERRLVEADVPFAPVLTVKEVTAHPQTEWLDLLERGPDGTMLVRSPLRFAGERPTRPFRAPRIGEHSREVALQAIAPAEVERLIGSGVLFQAGEQFSAGHPGQAEAGN
jgi:crotonobetainyl-CoA:carnitine CoA-transferase CaiB-like acyl-CoA transferase